MLALFFLAALLSAEDAGKIMRPADKAAMPSDQVDIVATAPDGKLELDGKPLTPEKPFPNVLHLGLKATPGEHLLALIWDGGRKDVHFFVGRNPPAGYEKFRQHPPVADVPCTQCHELSSRGRFRFKNDACFTCHQQSGFAKVHTHQPNVLTECGLCHNAHGSTVKAHLLYPKETACKQCHN
ncbi:MAG: cytochrome c3 family protein [Bryobacteraceae bacterium]